MSSMRTSSEAPPSAPESPGILPTHAHPLNGLGKKLPLFPLETVKSPISPRASQLQPDAVLDFRGKVLKSGRVPLTSEEPPTPHSYYRAGCGTPPPTPSPAMGAHRPQSERAEGESDVPSAYLCTNCYVWDDAAERERKGDISKEHPPHASSMGSRGGRSPCSRTSAMRRLGEGKGGVLSLIAT